jgi:hypothetical protein
LDLRVTHPDLQRRAGASSPGLHRASRRRAHGRHRAARPQAQHCRPDRSRPYDEAAPGHSASPTPATRTVVTEAAHYPDQQYWSWQVVPGRTRLVRLSFRPGRPTPHATPGGRGRCTTADPCGGGWAIERRPGAAVRCTGGAWCRSTWWVRTGTLHSGRRGRPGERSAPCRDPPREGKVVPSAG